MRDFIALIVTAVLLLSLSPFFNILDIDRTMFLVPVDAERLMLNIATFFGLYVLLRWLMAKIIG